MNWRFIQNIGILIIPIGLYFLPIAWLNGHSICLVKNIFGYDCFGCGITHAIVSVVQFHFDEAFYYNKLIVIVFPLLVYIWLKTLIFILKELKAGHKQKSIG